METGKQREVQGEFNVQRFYETLAAIISQTEKVAVTVKVTTPSENQKDTRRKTA